MLIARNNAKHGAAEASLGPVTFNVNSRGSVDRSVVRSETETQIDGPVHENGYDEWVREVENVTYAAIATPPPTSPPWASSEGIRWIKYTGRSCQHYSHNDAGEDDVDGRSLEVSKAVCLSRSDCQAVACPAGEIDACTVRQLANLVAFTGEDCYVKMDENRPVQSDSEREKEMASRSTEETGGEAIAAPETSELP
jgi:hypothetical protein